MTRNHLIPPDPQIDPLLRGRVVAEVVSLSRSSVWRAVRDGRFPAPLRTGVRGVAWRRSDIQAWLASRPVVASKRGGAQ